MTKVKKMGFRPATSFESLVALLFVPALALSAAQSDDKSAATPAAPAPPYISAPPPAVPHPSIPMDTRSPRQAMIMKQVWGVDNLEVRETASGALIRFSYRVVDPNKAKILNDTNLTPELIYGLNGAKMGVPHTEKIGKLRQVATPQSGHEYWMVFLNEGRFVQPGDRVAIVIGKFKAEGLIVAPSQSTLPTQKNKG
jgi:hypothetical protein